MSSVLSMSMPLDGFIAGPNVGPSSGLGEGGHRLHEWCYPDPDVARDDLAAGLTGANAEVMDELMSTGSVLAGRQTFGSRAAGAAITTTACRSSSSAAVRPALRRPGGPLATYLSDIEAAMARAREAAGEKDVTHLRYRVER